DLDKSHPTRAGPLFCRAWPAASPPASFSRPRSRPQWQPVGCVSRLEACSAAGFLQGLEKAAPIQVIPEDFFPAIAAVHDMVNGAWILDTNLASHASGRITASRALSKQKFTISLTDTFSGLDRVGHSGPVFGNANEGNGL